MFAQFMKDRKITIAICAFSHEAGPLKKHIQNIHQGLIRNYKCPTYDKPFSEIRNLNKHILSVHEGIKNHNCEFSDYWKHKQSRIVLIFPIY